MWHIPSKRASRTALDIGKDPVTVKLQLKSKAKIPVFDTRNSGAIIIGHFFGSWSVSHTVHL